MNRSIDRIFARRCASFVLAAACAVQLVTAQDELPPPLPPLPAANANGDILILRAGFHPPGPPQAGVPQTIILSRRIVKPGEIIDVREVRNTDRRVHAAMFGLNCADNSCVGTAAQFIGVGCACAAAGECACASHSSCGSECAAAKTATCKCCPCAAETEVSQNVGQGAQNPRLRFGLVCGSDCAEESCGEDNCQGAKVLFQHVRHVEEDEDLNPLKLMQHIAGLVGEKAAAIAALEVRKQADEQIGELYEAMSELMADNAALDARLEAQTGQVKLVEKMAELAAENARLKAHLELAAERAEVARQSAAMAVENERLKLQIAAIEQKHAIAEAMKQAGTRTVAKYPDGQVEIEEEATRTAAKPKQRKSR